MPIAKLSLLLRLRCSDGRIDWKRIFADPDAGMGPFSLEFFAAWATVEEIEAFDPRAGRGRTKPLVSSVSAYGLFYTPDPQPVPCVNMHGSFVHISRPP